MYGGTHGVLFAVEGFGFREVGCLGPQIESSVAPFRVKNEQGGKV